MVFLRPGTRPPRTSWKNPLHLPQTMEVQDADVAGCFQDDGTVIIGYKASEPVPEAVATQKVRAVLWQCGLESTVPPQVLALLDEGCPMLLWGLTGWVKIMADRVREHRGDLLIYHIVVYYRQQGGAPMPGVYVQWRQSQIVLVGTADRLPTQVSPPPCAPLPAPPPPSSPRMRTGHAAEAD